MNGTSRFGEGLLPHHAWKIYATGLCHTFRMGSKKLGGETWTGSMDCESNTLSLSVIDKSFLRGRIGFDDG